MCGSFPRFCQSQHKCATRGREYTFTAMGQVNVHRPFMKYLLLFIFMLFDGIVFLGNIAQETGRLREKPVIAAYKGRH